MTGLRHHRYCCPGCQRRWAHITPGRPALMERCPFCGRLGRLMKELWS